MAKKYPLNDHQLKVCQYSLLTGFGIADIRHNLVDLYNKPVFDGIPTSYLNRTVITNQRTALRSFQKNYGGKCKSKYISLLLQITNHIPTSDQQRALTATILLLLKSNISLSSFLPSKTRCTATTTLTTKTSTWQTLSAI